MAGSALEVIVKHRYRQAHLFFCCAFIFLGFGLIVAGWDGRFSFPPSAQAQAILNRPQALAPGMPVNNPVPEPDNLMILLDSSYSMKESLAESPENKMMAAKRTVMDVLRGISPDIRVGLRVYGNTANQFTACRASTMLVPLGQNNRNLMAAKLIGLRPTGATPISYAIQRSLDEDFRLVSGRRSIILISDGIETCGEDPCDLAVRLQKMGANIKINVVGLGLQDYDAIKQLRCVALATKGKFYTANTAAELANSLTNAMASEARVQATILPSAPPSSAGPPPNSGPAPAPSAKSGRPVYEDKLLPAAVPITPRKR